MEKAILLTADVTEDGVAQVIALDFDTEGDSLRYFYKHVDCDCVDIVPAYGLKDAPFLRDVCLVVDDEGLVAGKPVNPLASLLYGVLDHGQGLCGNVLVCKDVHTPDGIETGGLTDNEVMILEVELGKLVRRHNEKVLKKGSGE